MSQWTHVNGSFKFSKSPYSQKKDEVTIKYPNEQCKITQIQHWHMNDAIYVDFKISSLPLVKKIITPLIEAIIPYGETGFTYYINQCDKDYDCVSSNFTYDCEQDIFENLCKKKFKDEYNTNDYRLNWIQYYSLFTLTFSDDIRYCSGAGLYDSFMKLFVAFSESGIHFEKGIIEWTDEYVPTKLYSIRKFSVSESILFTVKDIQKNKIEKSDLLVYNTESNKLEKQSFDFYKDSLMTLYDNEDE